MCNESYFPLSIIALLVQQWNDVCCIDFWSFNRKLFEDTKRYNLMFSHNSGYLPQFESYILSRPTLSTSS